MTWQVKNDPNSGRLIIAEYLKTLPNNPDKARLALIYQLVTDMTSLYLIYNRPYAEQFTHFPCVQQIPQMRVFEDIRGFSFNAGLVPSGVCAAVGHFMTNNIVGFGAKMLSKFADHRPQPQIDSIATKNIQKNIAGTDELKTYNNENTKNLDWLITLWKKEYMNFTDIHDFVELLSIYCHCPNFNNRDQYEGLLEDLKDISNENNISLRETWIIFIGLMAAPLSRHEKRLANYKKIKIEPDVIKNIKAELTKRGYPVR